MLFKDAQPKNSTVGVIYTAGLDDYDIISWQEGIIKIRVPSVIREGYQGVLYGTPGTGKIKVIHNNGLDSVLSTQKLIITAAFLNQVEYSSGNINAKKPIYLVSDNCINGFVFTLHSSFQGKTAAINAVAAAIKEWRDSTGINLELEKDAAGNWVYQSDINTPYRNMIYFGGASTSLMSTTREIAQGRASGIAQEQIYLLTAQTIGTIRIRISCP